MRALTCNAPGNVDYTAPRTPSRPPAVKTRLLCHTTAVVADTQHVGGAADALLLTSSRDQLHCGTRIQSLATPQQWPTGDTCTQRRRLYQQLELVVDQPLPQHPLQDAGHDEQCYHQYQQEQVQQQQPQEGILLQRHGDLPQPDDLQQQVESAAASKEYQKNICRSLRAATCRTVEQLQEVVAEHGQHMDPQALAASFAAAARLAKQLPPDATGSASSSDRQWASSQLVQLLEQQLLPLLHQAVARMDAVGLQMVLHSLAALQYRQEVVVLGLEVAIAPVMHHLPLGRLCQLVWSLGQLGFRPQGQLIKTALRISGRHMSFLDALDMSQLLHGLVQLQVQLPPAYLDACCARVLQLCAHNQLGPRALCSIFHSLAYLVSQQQQQQLEPGCPVVAGLPQPLLERLLTATRQVLLAVAAGAEVQQPGLGQQQQQQQPERLGREHAWRSAQQQQPPVLQRPQQEPQQQHASADEREAPLQPQQQQQHQHQQCFSPAGLVMLSDAARLLKLDPPPDWQAAYAAAAQQLMPVADARNLPLMLAPLARWRRAPDQPWLQQYLAACLRLLDHIRPQGLAVLGHSLAALRVRPPAAWLQAYLAAAQARRLAATPAGCSCMMHVLGCWRQLGLLPAAGVSRRSASGAPSHSSSSSSGRQSVHSGAAAEAAASGSYLAAAAGQQLQWLGSQLAAECTVCFMEQHGRFTAEQLGMFCKGLTMWGLQGSPRLAGCLEEAVLQLLSPTPQQRPRKRRRVAAKQRVTAATLCNVLLALAVACPAAATPALMAQLWAAWCPWLLPKTTAAQAAAAAWALTRLQQQPPSAFVSELLQRVLLTADAGVQHLAEVLLAAQRGRWEVEQQQVQALLGAMLQRHAAQLFAASEPLSPWPRDRQHMQQQQQRLQHPGGHGPSSAHCVTVQMYNSSSSGGGALVDVQHHTRGWLLAAEAAVAWCDALPLQQCQHAVQLCVSSAQLVNAEHGRQFQAHARVLQSRLGRGAGIVLLTLPTVSQAPAARSSRRLMGSDEGSEAAEKQQVAVL